MLNTRANGLPTKMCGKVKEGRFGPMGLCTRDGGRIIKPTGKEG